MTTLGQLTQIFLYPVKSLPGIPLETAIMTKHGIAHPDNIQVVDRKWMVVNKTGNFLSQRNTPRLALIKQQYKDGRITLSAPGKQDISFSIEVPTRRVDCRLWQNPLTLFGYGGEIGQWLSDFLGLEGLDLVNLGDFALNERNKKEFDYNRYMLISEATLAELNSRLENKVSMRNFRPNFVCKDTPEFGEDTWTYLRIGDCDIKRVAYCIRCILTTVDPDTGIKSKDMQPLKTLKQYRMNEEIDKVGPLFGAYLDWVEGNKTVAIGDLIVSRD